MNRYFITGTDTNVGKTLASAILTLACSGYYWKPLQSGLIDEVADVESVKTITNLPSTHFYPSTYQLQASLSPYHAATQENIEIDFSKLIETPFLKQHASQKCFIEGAGGLYVPITHDYMMLDLMAHWNYPVIIVARGTLGTINHTLLTIEALRQNNIKIQGIIFSGELNRINQETIEDRGQVKTLFTIPHFDLLSPTVIQQWVAQNQHTILAGLA